MSAPPPCERGTAYETSIALAREKGCFPFLERDRYLEGEFVRRLPKAIRDGIAEHGIRNSHLIAIAPTGVYPGFNEAYYGYRTSSDLI